MRRKQLLAAALLVVLAGCTDSPQNTQVSPGPLQGSNSATPSAKPTQTPVTPSPSPSRTTTTTPEPVACRQVSWNTNAQAERFGQQAQGSAFRAGVTWEACYDRFTVTLSGTKLPGYHAEYVSAVHMDGSGNLVRLKGSAFLLLVVNAPDGPPVIIKPDVGKMIQQVKPAGAFEGNTSFAIGLDQKRPFAVRTYAGPTKNTVRVMVSFARQ